MANNNMHNLTTLIKRLEAATSRLEDIAASTFESDSSNTTKAPSITSGTTVTPTAPKAPSAPAPKPVVSLPPSIERFDNLIINGPKGVVAWKEKTAKLDSALAGQAAAVVSAFEAQRQFLLAATKAKKPDFTNLKTMTEVLRDINGAFHQVEELKQTNRASHLNNHFSMVADGVLALGWVTVDGGRKPAEYVAELVGGAEFFGNKIVVLKDPQHVEWVQAYYAIYKELGKYIGEFYERGVPWNKDGIDAIEALKQIRAAPSGPSPAASGAPPPPPPPPLPTFDGTGPPPPPPPPGAPPAPRAPAPDMGAVFDALNRGSDVTKGLKKVDASQMTHKNPSLRTNSTVPERGSNNSSPISRSKSPAPPGKKPKPESMRTKKPPKKELDGNKWIVENFDNPGELVTIEANLTQSILITKCSRTTIRVVGKANAVSIDNSSRASVVLDNLVSSIDVIKCPNFAVQVLGAVPTILLDQVDSASIYLSKTSLETEIFTSKCSSININLPPPEEDGDYTEHPAPEQLRSYVKNGALVTEIVEHAG